MSPWTASDIWVNKATDPGTPANLRKMAAYRRFTDTNNRIVRSTSLFPMNLAPRPPRTGQCFAFISALEILYGWADDHLIDFHFDRLLDCVSDRSRDRAGRD